MQMFTSQLIFGGLLACSALTVFELFGGLSETKRNAQLISAAAQGDVQTVRTFLEQGADPNAQQGSISSPLWWAVNSGSRPTVEILLAYGADPNSRGQHNSVLEQAIVTLRHFQGTLDEPCHIAIVKALINYGASIDDTQSDDEHILIQKCA